MDRVLFGESRLVTSIPTPILHRATGLHRHLHVGRDPVADSRTIQLLVFCFKNCPHSIHFGPKVPLNPTPQTLNPAPLNPKPHLLYGNLLEFRHTLYGLRACLEGALKRG